MGEDPRVQLRRHRGVPVLSLIGDLDQYSALQLRQPACDLIDQALTEPADPSPADKAISDPSTTAEAPQVGRHDVLVLDLAAVPFTDSAGLGTLVAMLQRVRAHRAGLAIAGASTALQQTLQLMGLTKVVTLFPTAEEAVAATAPTRGTRPASGG